VRIVDLQLYGCYPLFGYLPIHRLLFDCYSRSSVLAIPNYLLNILPLLIVTHSFIYQLPETANKPVGHAVFERVQVPAQQC
jgi:hypothetical protein